MSKFVPRNVIPLPSGAYVRGADATTGRLIRTTSGNEITDLRLVLDRAPCRYKTGDALAINDWLTPEDPGLFDSWLLKQWDSQLRCVWRLDETGTPTEMADATGGGSSLEVVNGGSMTFGNAGIHGNAVNTNAAGYFKIRADAINGMLQAPPDNDPDKGIGEFTISLWIRRATIPAYNTEYTLFHIDDSARDIRGYYYCNATPGASYLRMVAGLGYTFYYVEPSVLFDGNWHNVVFSREFTYPATPTADPDKGIGRVFLDGVMGVADDYFIYEHACFRTQADLTRYLYIGADSLGATLWDGELDEVTFWFSQGERTQATQVDASLSYRGTVSLYNPPVPTFPFTNGTGRFYNP